VPTLDFGWVVQPIPWPDMLPADLHEYTRASIRALSPHFSTIWVEDHLQWGGYPTLEAFATIAYLAAEFPQYRIGSIVFGQGYRNPALLAKMAATLQYLSGGRFILGLGAGWKEDEHRAYGYPFPPGRVRVAQLAEAIQLMRAMWTQSPATFTGKHYTVEHAYCEPRPDPMIPIHVGGGGEKETLSVVARYADAWNFNLSGLEEFQHKLGVLKQHCQAVGRTFHEIALTYYTMVDLSSHAPRVVPRKDFLYLLGPTPANAIAQLRPFVELGVSHILLRTANLQTLERFGAEVAPALVQGTMSQRSLDDGPGASDHCRSAAGVS
jgi:alkanesulfonate monooxygenase SsuD/methylene tetrahydromethanopterin reductase-like flavin-dependent oxidoreductase (luciferase family)